MPWPAIAAIAGKVIGGLGAAGAAGGGAGAAGASAGGIGGMLGGGGGGMMGGKGLMGMMGGAGGGGGQGGGGGMMQGIMQQAPHKKMSEAGAAIQGGLVNMLEAQDGLGINPQLLGYLSKMQGSFAENPALTGNTPIGQTPAVTDNATMASGLEPGANMAQVPAQDLPDAAGSAPSIAMPDQSGMPSLQNPMGQPQQQSMTPSNPDDMKTNLPGANQGPPKKGAAGTIGSLMGMMGKGNYTTDSRGVTQVSESSDILGNSMKKIDPKNPASLVTAAVSFVGGKVQQASEKRRAVREEAQLASDFSRAQQASSVYADPNSVYYSAKDGAPVSLSKMMVGGKVKC